MRRKINSTYNKILSFSLIAIILSILSYSTFSTVSKNLYEQDSLKFSNLDFEILEKDKDGNNLDFKKIEILPGDNISCSLKVKNNSNSNIYVRVKKRVEVDSNIANENLINFEINKDAWYLEDGFYIYKNPLKPEEVSESLFNQISFSKDISNEYMGKNIELYFDGDAIQSIGRWN